MNDKLKLTFEEWLTISVCCLLVMALAVLAVNFVVVSCQSHKLKNAQGLLGEADTGPEELSVPILMYHHIVESGETNDDTVSLYRFAEHMDALNEAGYTPVSFDDLRSFVLDGDALPEKPVVITFDDGYESNYTLAYPVLKAYGFKATIFVVGVSVGKDSYKDSGIKMTPHFSLDQAAEMTASGLITVANHGYNLHEIEGRDKDPIRRGAIKLANESYSEFVDYLIDDYERQSQLENVRTDIFSYPYGVFSNLSEATLSNCGVWASVTTNPGSNIIKKGSESCLHLLNRYYVLENQSGEDLIEMISSPDYQGVVYEGSKQH